MFTQFLATLRQRHALRQSVGTLLRRADEHLLDDIGLTRDEISRMIDAPAQTSLGRIGLLTKAAAFA